MKIKTENLQDTKNLANAFASSLCKKGLFVTLTGDIGAGKTQFIRYVLEFLKVDKKITSPSFVILNEYKCELFPIYHFDLYRLEEKGLNSIIPELRQYSKDNALTFIEWAQFAHDEIPKSSLRINVEYDEDNVDVRWFEFIDTENKNEAFLKELAKRIKS